MNNPFKLKAKIWIYEGSSSHSSNAAAMKGEWHFITIPKIQSDTIKKIFGSLSRGWGSLPVIATIGNTSWKTSIFPDKKLGSYLLPVKLGVRRIEKIKNGDIVSLNLKIIT